MMSNTTFNPYEFVAGAGRPEPHRKFYPIERCAPFRALLGLDVYVERWRLDGTGTTTTASGSGGAGGIMGSLVAGLGSSIIGGGEDHPSSSSMMTASTTTTHAGGAANTTTTAAMTASTTTTTTTTTASPPQAFTAAPMYEQLAKALSFQCHLVQESERNMYSSSKGGGGNKGGGVLDARNNNRNTLDYLRPNQIALEACIVLISMLPHSAGASGKALDGLFLNFINTLVNLIGNLQPNQQLVFPGGWQTPDSAHLCLYVLRRNNNGASYSFSVLNTGPAGLEYHRSNFDPTSGRQTKQLCLTIQDIPHERITDSTFWVCLFRMQVYPSKRNTSEFLYEKLLTSLNSRPLHSNYCGGGNGGGEFMYPPPTKGAALQYYQLALLGLTYIPDLMMMDGGGGGGATTTTTPTVEYSSLLVRNAAVEIAYRGIEDARPSSMDPEDTRILQLTARNLANFASTLNSSSSASAAAGTSSSSSMSLGVVGETNTISGGGGGGADATMVGIALSNTWELLDKLLAKLSIASSRPLDQHSAVTTVVGGGGGDAFDRGLLKTLRAGEGSASHPFFGRLRRDNYEEVVKALMVRGSIHRVLSSFILYDFIAVHNEVFTMPLLFLLLLIPILFQGDPRPDPILIPAVLTDEGMPEVATDYHTAASSLLRICHACSLLLQQRRLVKNAPAFVASAAQHALTVTLPMPHLDASICFWRRNPMRRETQTNLLFLIRRMCRIYSAATSSVQQSRGLVGIRTTAFACGACVADAIARVKCIDDPSPFSLHYSGLNEGPTRPFGFESGSFESLAANLPIYDPQLTALRFQCLDYMRGMTINDDETWNPTIFNFDISLTPHGGDLELINHLSIELALPRPYPCTETAMITHAARLISGQNGAILEILPEFEYFRDVSRFILCCILLHLSTCG